jgi:hypothetical protein
MTLAISYSLLTSECRVSRYYEIMTTINKAPWTPLALGTMP